MRSAWPWMVALLIVVELVIRLPNMNVLEYLSEASRFERVFAAASQRSTSPKIGAFGSSRFQYAVVPRQMELRMGLRKGDVTNVGFASATPQDYLNLYITKHDYFSGLDTMLLEVGEFAYNWTLITDEGMGDQRFRALSNFYDRTKIPGLGAKADYVLGYLLESWDARGVVRLTLLRAFTGDFDNSIEIDSDGQIDTYIRTDDIPDPEESKDLAHHFYRNYRFSEYQLNALVELVRLAQTNGVAVSLIQPPLSPEFNSEIELNYVVENRVWRDRVQAETGLQIIEINHSDPVCADWRQCYYDYGHMNSIGADSFSISLADYLIQ